MYYVQFYSLGNDNKLHEALGSDSVYILDGRLTIDNMIGEGFQRFEEIKRVKGYYKAFKVMKGSSFSDGLPVSRIIEL